MHRLAMIGAGLLALSLTALAMPPAMAQRSVESDDAAYCKRLAGLQERYGRSANTSNSMDTNTALNNCAGARAAGKAAEGQRLQSARTQRGQPQPISSRPAAPEPRAGPCVILMAT